MSLLTVNFGAKRVTVTSALPYINGIKHLGNIAGSLLPADIFHRFLDLMGIPNIYICGTDEHGTPAEFSALKEGMAVEDYVDKYYKIQRDIYEKWGFDFTFFGRTSSKTHAELTQEIFLSQYKNGFISENTLLLPFCKNCQKFLPDRFVSGECPDCGYESARGDQCESCGKVLDPAELVNPKCNICKSSGIEFKKEKHLFLLFDKLSDKLEKWILESTHWPDNTRNFALGWIKDGLKPRCITRNLEWGIKVPLKGFDHLVFYVWYDAPIGYISITKDAYNKKKISDWKIWWTNKETKIYHFLGKDNVPFHTIFWPGILLAARNGIEFQLPYHVAGYEYLNWEGLKFSTSKGIGLFSDEALDLFPADYWRFYLSSILPERKDSNFEWEDFKNRINNELIANFGNLFYRVTKLIETKFGSVPKPGIFGKAEKALENELKALVKKIENCVKEVRLKDCLKEILAFSSRLNAYFQSKAPWDATKEESATTLFVAVNCLKAIVMLLYPYIPFTIKEALKCLGVKREQWEKIGEFTIRPGHNIKSKLLFKKVEYIKKGDRMISIDEFKRIDMRTARVENVEDHPNADKLYVLKIEVGGEKRQLVAGLKNIYTKEELKGKQIIVLMNLEPAIIRGVKSEGMLLATEDGILITPEKETKSGKRVV